MSDDTSPNKLKKTEDLQPIKNRKQRRYEAKLARSKKQYRSYWYWHRRIANEMKENKVVQQKIIDGKFDYFLENPVNHEQASG